mmetsp:Transcript_4967/g.5726  ORF Transcript_4967/g.5726 Transcript_4967/m.5726 type:complete len:85 (+) Transcript_4967:667-921(+)
MFNVLAVRTLPLFCSFLWAPILFILWLKNNKCSAMKRFKSTNDCDDFMTKETYYAVIHCANAWLSPSSSTIDVDDSSLALTFIT